jgi:ABC-type oligopeptide transport system substrate-binding subunit/DNA-binding SARP family transcriptional activator
LKLSVSVLGPFHASLSGKPVARFRTKKVQALLVYLLVEAAHNPGHAHQREALMELLWPGLPLKSAQENLRQTIYQLRKTLTGVTGDSGASFLISNRQEILVDPDFDYELDSVRFKQLIDAGLRSNDSNRVEHLEAAIKLYRGDFLAGFYLVDSIDFEEWSSTWRSKLQQMASKALHKITTYAIDNAEYAKAESYAHRHLEIDPLNEEAALQRIQALSLQGQRTAALTYFEDYRQRLSKELSLQPDTRLLEVVEGLRTAPYITSQNGLPDSHTSSGPSSRAHFFARVEQLQQLKRQLEQALSSQERVVFITGEAGTGKTALMNEFARRSVESIHGLLVLKGSSNAITGGGDPYHPFRQALAHLIGGAGDQYSDTAAGMVSARDRLFEHYTQVLRRLSKQQPLLVLLDDLQWADRASINLLFHLVRELLDSRILILGSYRPSELAIGPQLDREQGQIHPLTGVVNEFKRQFGDIQVNLDRFSIEEGRSLIDTYLDRSEKFNPNRLGEGFRSKLFWKTRGHPLFMVELLREMSARHDLVQDEEGRWVEDPGLNWDILPARVEAVIQQRISRLDADLLELLSIASLEGEEFTVQVVGRVAGLDEHSAFRSLSHELEKRHGLVHEQAELQVGQLRLSRYRFSHALFQQFLADQLNQGEKRLLHGKIAQVLEEIQSEDEQAFTLQLAHHHSQAGNGRKAVYYLMRAGDLARNLYAHEEATHHYHSAIEILLELGDRDGAAHALMKLGLTHHSAFDFDQARQAYKRGFTLWQEMAGELFPAAKLPAPHPFRVAWQDPPTLDPSMGGTNLTAPIVTQIFSGLVALSPDLEVIPDIAESWDLLEEGRKYVFHLRQDVTWSDGRPVTAADFEFTYKRALDPATKTPIAALLLDGLLGARDFRLGLTSDPSHVGVHAVDDHTLVIELEEPVSYFLQQLTYYVLLPVPQHCLQAHGAQWSEPENIVTNGPFLLAGWTKGEIMRLERNPHFHGRLHGNLQAIDIALGLSPEEQFDRYETGQQDLLVNWFISSASMADVIDRRKGEWRIKNQFATSYLIVNPHRPPLDDKKVRQALAMSVDRTALNRRISKGYNLPASGGFTPPGMPGHASSAGLDYDVDQARRLLSGSSQQDKEGFPPILLMTYTLRESTARILLEDWRKNLQLDIDLDLRPAQTFLQDYFATRPGLALAGWWADYADPENFLRVCVQMDLPDWHHPQFEDLLEKARRTTDQDLRMEIYRQADHILMDEAVIIPLYYFQGIELLQPWVKNYRSTAVKHPGFWKDVIIEHH